MASTLPKHSSEKRARNIPAVPPMKLPLHHDRPVPPLPKIGSPFKWTAVGKNYWKTLWSSPMALVFIEADYPALVRMTALTEMFALGEANAAVMSELRQLEDRFGMSLMARRRLQFDVDLASNRMKPEEDREPENESRWLRVVEAE